MRYRIRHDIEYRYSRAVFLEPMTVRLRPRSDAAQRLESFTLAIEPRPAGRTACIDIDGNTTEFVWFDGTHERLAFQMGCEVETFRTNPFDYIITPLDLQKLPLAYPNALKKALSPYMDQTRPEAEVEAVVREMIDRASGETLAFLKNLNSTLHERIELIERLEGMAQPAADTLRRGKGACRDIAALFMAVCRAMGLAARFVSGYAEGDPDMDLQELHAWAEVYLPGGGWRGFDPTLGLAVADRHIAIAAAATPELTMPAAGTYRGTDVTSEITFRVQLKPLV